MINYDDTKENNFVACIGSACVDIVTYVNRIPLSGEGVYGTPVKYIGGGCAANVASGLAKAGINVKLFGRVGNDKNGDFVIQDLINRNVDVSCMIRDQKAPTGEVFILVEPNGERTLIPCVIGAAYIKCVIDDYISMVDDPPKATFLSGPLLNDEPSHSSLIEIAYKLKGKSTLFFDPNIRYPFDSIPEHVKSGVKEITRISDYVLIEKNEFSALDLTIYPNQIYVIKIGDQGSYIRTQDSILCRVDAHKMAVKDTIGAGDAFNAAFMAALMKGYDPTDSLKIANFAGGLAVTIEGARCMPEWEDILDLFNNEP